MSQKEDDLVKEAQDRFKRCEQYESKARENYLYDYRFVNGDSSNMFQWPVGLAQSRASTDLPCLTVNKTRQHCLQIINDQRQNESSINIRPTGDGATFEAAQVLEGLCRHIEYQSNAEAAYANATDCQVKGGIGYWRVLCDYENDGSFDQTIYIRRVPDPLSIYLDPDIQEYDGSDAKFGFVFKDMTRDEYDKEYGKDASDDIGQNAPLGVGSSEGWDDEDHVRVCEYYRTIYKNDKLHHLIDGSTMLESQAQDVDRLKQFSLRSRDVQKPQIEWYLLAGSKIIDQKDWPGKYIPLVRVVGEETVIDKVMDRKGHARQLIDINRMYNYWTSSAVEHIALQTKTPYIAAAEAIESYQEEWRNANLENLTVLPYNAMREDGTAIPKPEREQPPVMAPAYLAGLKITQGEFMMASGQYEANMGEKSNEVSGKAVQERQRQGDNSTYHYIDHLAQSIRYTGRILIDLIPKIYDTKRVSKILGMDGKQTTVQIDPSHPVAHQQVQDPDGDDYDPQAIGMIFNPNVGQYSVEADIGPAFATKRQETFNALTQILQTNESLVPLIGDLLFKAADFPLADEIGERMKNMVPKQALGQDAPNPQIIQLQQQLAQQHQVMSQQASDLVAMKQEKQIAEYKAETDRIKAVGSIDPAAMMPIIRQMVSDVLGTPINPIIAAHAAENAAMAQPPQAPPNPVAMQHAQDMQQQAAQQQSEQGQE